MTGNQATLLFVGVILGVFAILAIIFIAMGTYRQKKIEKAYRNHKDLQKAKRDWECANAKHNELREERKQIMNAIDIELSRKPYLTKVKAFEQEKELEKLRYELEVIEPKVQDAYDLQRKLYLEWRELRVKYGIYNID
jgi:type III secretory pathway component EscV